MQIIFIILVLTLDICLIDKALLNRFESETFFCMNNKTFRESTATVFYSLQGPLNISVKFPSFLDVCKIIVHPNQEFDPPAIKETPLTFA